MTIKQSTGVSAEFGYYPKPIEIENDRFSVKTLPNFQEILAAVKEDSNVYKNWIYPGAQQSIDFNGVTSTRPYNARVFGMHKTHMLTLHNSDNLEDIDFVVWCLSFFTGMRLSVTEAGFLDATPIKDGTLVDFLLSECTIEDAIELGLDYLEAERSNFRATKRVTAVIHSLFLAQYPQNLPFERFQYLYMGLDSCFKLIQSKDENKAHVTHATRLEWMCKKFDIPTPKWAIMNENKSDISIVRNDTIHEALFFDEPLGFSIYGGNQSKYNQGNVILQMQHLICRLLVAILGKPKAEYVRTNIDTRQNKGLNLRQK
ncbi:MAG: hypothetical protein RR677_03670 [Acinetobacter sp.]